jgi:hypothetical protein
MGKISHLQLRKKGLKVALLHSLLGPSTFFKLQKQAEFYPCNLHYPCKLYSNLNPGRENKTIELSGSCSGFIFTSSSD